MKADVIQLAHETANARAFEAALLQLLEREVGFDAAYFSVKGAEAFPSVVGLEDAIVKRAIARGRKYFRELLPVKHAALAARGVAVDTDVLGSERVRRTRYFREIAASVAGRHSLMAYIPWRGRIIAALMLGRAGSGFSNQEMRRVESLLPSLGLARAAYGLPCTFEPLRAPTNPGLLRRLGFDRRFEILASTPTRDGTLVVRDLEGFREMVATAGGSELIWTRAALRDPSESGWPYVELLHLAAALAKQRRSALFVGCGGAVAMRQFARVYPGIGIDVVEREATVIELARAWYDLDAIPGVTVHVADGVDFIAHAAPSSWDVVVVDAYDAADIATAFARRPFFATLRRALHPGGAMAFNVIGTLDEPGPVRDIVRAARAELDSVRIVPVMGLDETYSPSTRRNVVVLATRAVQ